MGIEQVNWDEVALEAVATLEPVEPPVLVAIIGALGAAAASPDALPSSWGEDANGAVSRIRNGGLIEQTRARTWQLTEAGRTEIDKIDATKVDG